MKRRTRCAASCCAIAGFALAIFSSAWAASPEEEYQAALRSYRSGDMVGAMAALRQPADAGHGGAQVLLAYILRGSSFNEEAFQYYGKAARNGDPEGEFGLASLYAAGEGVARDPAEARKWFTRAAEKGHRQAIAVLARAYMEGGLALSAEERASPASLQWIARSAEANDLRALRYLADAYRSGTAGVAVDLEQAQALEARWKMLAGAEANKGKKGRK